MQLFDILNTVLESVKAVIKTVTRNKNKDNIPTVKPKKKDKAKKNQATAR